ncbi:hypothetical protein OIU78_000716 [Salix suchowensis]|nr:hypothetical protein OIU78_000716 [Salix suchowensis]
MSSSSEHKLAHVALLPSAGMGHLTPFLRLAASLTLQSVNVTFITPHPTVSLAESQALSQLFASFPQIKHQQFHLLSLDNPLEDPFFEHFRLIKESSHLLSPASVCAESTPFCFNHGHELGNNILKTSFLEDSEKVAESSGILVNTFESFEQESLRTLNDRQILLKRLPSVVAIGPLPPCDFEKGQLQLTWLHDQPAGSVMYVSFGSRTALSKGASHRVG